MYKGEYKKFNNPPETVIREAAFCNEAVDMRISYQRYSKCVKDTAEPRNKVIKFIVVMEQTQCR